MFKTTFTNHFSATLVLCTNLVLNSHTVNYTHRFFATTTKFARAVTHML